MDGDNSCNSEQDCLFQEDEMHSSEFLGKTNDGCLIATVNRQLDASGQNR